MNVRIPSKSELIQKDYEAYFRKAKSINDFVNNNIDDMRIISEGSKVKLNYESLINEPDYPKKVKKYKDFVEQNKDKIFTVQYDTKYKDKPILVVLAEDENEVKWLWHCEHDLIVVDKND